MVNKSGIHESASICSKAVSDLSAKQERDEIAFSITFDECNIVLYKVSNIMQKLGF